MKPRHAWAIALRQFYLMRGSPVRILPMFGWVTLDILLWGFITRYLNTLGASGAGFDFVARLLGAVLLWDFLVRAMQGVAVAFLEDVWSRNFLNFFATPLSIPEYLAGLIGTAMVTSLAGLGAMVVVAGAVFGFSMASLGLFAAPFVAVLFLFGIALGVAASALVLRLGPAGEWLIWPIPAVLAPFAGVFYPLSTLPAWMQPIARTLPASHVFEALRSLVAGRSVPAAAIAWSMILSIAWLLAACWFFTVIYQHVVRSGLIARYSAETVN